MPLVMTSETDPGTAEWTDAADLPTSVTLDSLFDQRASFQWGEAYAGENAAGDTATLTGSGLFPASNNVLNPTGDTETGADGLYVPASPGLNANGGLFIEQANSLEMTQGRLLPRLNIKGSLSVLTDIRHFAGLTDDTAVVTSDAPAANYVGFQFSSPRGDTNWQLIYDNATGQTIVDTGIAVAADTVLYFDIKYLTSTSVRFSIYDNTYTNVLYTTTVTVPVAAATTLPAVLFLSRNLVALRECNRTFSAVLVNRNLSAVA